MKNELSVPRKGVHGRRHEQMGWYAWIRKYAQRNKGGNAIHKVYMELGNQTDWRLRKRTLGLSDW